jgi:peptide/nickel transport system permease protein
LIQESLTQNRAIAKKLNLRNSGLIRLIRERAYVRAGIIIISFFVGLAILSFFYLPYDPLATTGPNFAKPSLAHPFGTTVIGQDVLSQWVFGSRATLFVGLLTALLTTLIGITVGIASGFIRNLDEPLMRTADVVLTLPTLPLLIVISSFFRPSIVLVAVLIALLAWPAMARVLRSSVISLRELSFIEVALLSGVPRTRIMFSDLLKHLIPLIIAYSLFAVIGAILAEAALDFIGVGPIDSYSWGAMLALAQDNSAEIYRAWWWVAVPGVSIAALGTGFAFLAYGLEDFYKR